MRHKQQIEQKIQSVNTLLDNLKNGINNRQYKAEDILAILANIKRQTDFIEERLELESQD